jgi:hypothetical protein
MQLLSKPQEHENEIPHFPFIRDPLITAFLVPFGSTGSDSLNPDQAFHVNPDPDTVSGFDQQNLRKKKKKLKNKFFFFRSKIAIYFP